MIKHINYNRVDVCAFQHAKRGNLQCGDGFFVNETNEYFICAVADGLGSGEKAKISSSLVMKTVEEYQISDIEFIMEKCNDALRDERGAVVSIFKVYYNEKLLRYCSVGNIQFFLYSPGLEIINPIPSSGFLSGRPQSLKVKTYKIKDNASFIIFSDGLKIRSTKKFLQNLSSPLEGSKVLQENVYQPMDDVTFLLGSIR